MNFSMVFLRKITFLSELSLNNVKGIRKNYLTKVTFVFTLQMVYNVKHLEH